MFEPLVWLTPVYFLGQSFATPRGNSGFAAYAGTGDYMSFILLGTVLSNYVAAVFWGMGFTGNVLAALGAFLPLLLAIFGFGFAFAALVLLMRDANTLVDVSNFLLSLLAGSNFPVRALPRFLLPLSLALPLTYGYDAVRGYLLHTRTLLPLKDEMAILLAFMGVMIPLGFAVFKRIERRCRVLGTLGSHCAIPNSLSRS